MALLTATDKLFGTTTLDEHQAALAKKTYAFLSLAIGGAIFGGYVGMNSPTMARIFSSFVGWILALVLINVVPRIALWAAAQKQTGLSLLALAMDGAISGLVLSPLLLFANIRFPAAISAALGVTASVFVGVTGYMMLTRSRFSAPVGLFTGIFFSILGAILLSWMLPGLTFLSLAVAVGIGIMGVLMLVYATSDVLNNPDFDNPMSGALMLFAALFNIFQSALFLMLRIFGGSRE